ncbi:2-oxoglutarate-Fe(II) type oxidoreductase ppzD [Maniola jurtina]|uniref:2-oxoglutarate-Fe(II) type oxidoreductase ppzD n=1 Tax=Maniola jurtina TaxID=191418 RepID=UPI001E68FC21|nr:2-oxoglutarate-Fe(II) type oxidoreductase ppzD [Maniola jurtina]
MATALDETLLSRCEIPIIDLAHIGTDVCPMKSVVRRIGQQLFTALSEKGLAMLVNHGIAEEKLKAVYADLDNFCALPEGSQAQYLCNPDSNHGYVRPGMEQFDITKKELRHSFNITTLSAASMPAQEEVPEFTQHAVPLAHDLTNLSRVLLQALAYAFGLAPATMLACHSGMLKSDGCNRSSMRILYYPPVPPEDEGPCCQRDGQAYTRCGAHSDACTFTLVAQDSEGGLEVKLNDKWQAVGHLPGAILVQPGELLASWTTNLLPALMHRVVVPTGTYARARGRHCVAFFCHPDKDAVIPPIAPRAVPAPAPPAFTPHVHLTLHHRLMNAAHHIQKRFRETYA